MNGLRTCRITFWVIAMLLILSPKRPGHGKIVNALINFLCAVSFQLMFTRYSFDEVSSIERMSTLLDNLTGIQDQMIGNVSFAVAEKHAETYKYYERNKMPHFLPIIYLSMAAGRRYKPVVKGI